MTSKSSESFHWSPRNNISPDDSSDSEERVPPVAFNVEKLVGDKYGEIDPSYAGLRGQSARKRREIESSYSFEDGSNHR